MERREFIRNGIILFAAPTIIKIENLMRISVPREIFLIKCEKLAFEKFQREIIRQIAIDYQVPVHMLTRDYKSTWHI
ncbi:MAG: hypothetical protein KAR06_02525 [Deltaproteobacteria bacterium]|nr:hypothetical protein [Deltaproteobacteria bacterium]